MNRRERDQLFEDAQQAIGAAHDDVERAVAALKTLLEAGDSIDLNAACPICQAIVAELTKATPGAQAEFIPQASETTPGTRKGGAGWN